MSPKSCIFALVSYVRDNIIMYQKGKYQVLYRKGNHPLQRYTMTHTRTGCRSDSTRRRRQTRRISETIHRAKPALNYLLEQFGYKVERQVFSSIYWDDVQPDRTYRMDFVIDGNIIVELKAVAHIDTPHRRQLWSYMNLTHLPFGMLINFFTRNGITATLRPASLTK